MPRKRKQSKRSKNTKLSTIMSADKGIKNVSKFTGDDNFTYISEFNKVGIMRNIYKEETKNYMEQHLEEKLRSEKNSKLQMVNKVRSLLDYDKSLLQQMDRNRVATGEIMEEFIKISKTVLDTTNRREQGENLYSTEEAIRNLISDIQQ